MVARLDVLPEYSKKNGRSVIDPEDVFIYNFILLFEDGPAVTKLLFPSGVKVAVIINQPWLKLLVGTTNLNGLAWKVNEPE
jgi:hypothetical protein